MSKESEDVKSEGVDSPSDNMKQEDEVLDEYALNGKSPSLSAVPKRSATSSPMKSSASITPKDEDEHEERLGGDITISVESTKAPKLSRKSSQKVVSRPPPLFDDLPDSTADAKQTFQVIKDCIYGSKYMGSSEHDALGCDCSEEWSKLSFGFICTSN